MSMELQSVFLCENKQFWLHYILFAKKKEKIQEKKIVDSEFVKTCHKHLNMHCKAGGKVDCKNKKLLKLIGFE